MKFGDKRKMYVNREVEAGKEERGGKKKKEEEKRRKRKKGQTAFSYLKGLEEETKKRYILTERWRRGKKQKERRK